MENIEVHVEDEELGIYTYTLESPAGIKVTVTNYGAAVYRILAPDRNGRLEEIALSCDTMEDFRKNTAFFGATIGRVANRIKDGKIKVDGREFQLTQNEGRKHAHGGKGGFDKKIWDGKISHNAVEFTYISLDGEEGYPGCVTVMVRYQLEGETLKIRYQAQTTSDTIINLTNHTYFNLAGQGRGKIYDQKLRVCGRFYLESDEQLIPTGQIRSVLNTPFDFTAEKPIGRDIYENDPMLVRNQGYDVTFVKEERGFARAAVLRDEESGRCLEVFTDYPAIHLYTGNFLENEPGLHGKIYNRHESVCLEAQRFPYASGFSHFGEIELKAGEKMERNIWYRMTREGGK